ncbi:hypothetical protein [Pelagerythrobacter marensis]|uniref:Uncharacterized protein n=1 Tax=Pelagerythrobacter marensis TaxID=543877 RepID=A0A0G3XDB3_9SPHN|nr:hypothetical protein [Pelagerythrobacter marensis]AKM08574.1 hypothetical protein AM2010_2519 [Pelagerythrobacter marensis]
MGEYEPNDSRNVTLQPGHEPGGIERTGPREGETRDRAATDKPAEGTQQDLNTAAIGQRQAGEPVVGETSDDPARRARADAARPVSG